jgi:DNA-binding CsgD family transcriptional regulator
MHSPMRRASSRSPHAADAAASIGGSNVSSPFPLLTISLPDQRVRAANAAAADLLGCSMAELRRCHLPDLVSDGHHGDRALSALAAGEVDSYRTTMTFVCAAGPRAAPICVRAIPRSNGAMALVTFLFDEPGNNSVVAVRTATAPAIALGTMNVVGRVVAFTRHCAEVHEPTRGSDSNWSLASLVHPDDQVVLRSGIDHCRRDRRDVMVAVRVRHQSVGWLKSDCHLFWTGDGPLGEPVGFVLTEADVPTPTAGRLAQLEEHLARISAEIRDAGLGEEPSDQAKPPELLGLISLTPRQRDIVRRLIGGARVPTIAESLFISRSTVRNHLATVYRVFDVHSQAELIELLRAAS